MMQGFGTGSARRLLLAALVLPLHACTSQSASEVARDAEGAAPAAAELDRAAVSLPALADSVVTLRDGLSGDPGRHRWVSRIEGIEAEADFDGDGVTERAVLMTANTGGSPVFLNVVAYARGSAGPEQKAVLQLGDHVQLHRFEAHGDTLVVEFSEGSGARASTSGRTTRRLRIEGRSWVDVSVAN